MITSSIERAQKKVEENNFGIRKRLLEYDDVMNSQREVVYRRRRNALYGDRLAVDIANMVLMLAKVLLNCIRIYAILKVLDWKLFVFFQWIQPLHKRFSSKRKSKT